MMPLFKNVLRKPSFKKENEDLTIDEIIEVQQETSESGIISSNLLSSKSSNTQFQATKTWNKLITKFYEKMPKGKHRGLILSYNDTFTGKAAIQFLVTTLFPEIVPNKPVDETNAIKFMELLLKKKLVQNCKLPESEFFQCKAIYRFITVNIAEEIEATNLKRSNSTTNLKKASSNFSSSFRPTAADRRISSSCNNLPNMIKAQLKIESSEATRNPFKYSAVLKPTPENAEEQHENYCQNRIENEHFMTQINSDHYRNPRIRNNIFQTPTTSSSISDARSTLPSSAFSISTYSSPQSTKRCANFDDSGIPLKKANQRPMSYYNTSTECQTASKAEEYLQVLDSIIADEMFTERQKERKLAAFRESYPQIYLIRFPEAAFPPKPKPRHPTPIRVLNKLIRRNSSKRK